MNADGELDDIQSKERIKWLKVILVILSIITFLVFILGIIIAIYYYSDKSEQQVAPLP